MFRESSRTGTGYVVFVVQQNLHGLKLQLIYETSKEVESQIVS